MAGLFSDPLTNPFADYRNFKKAMEEAKSEAMRGWKPKTAPSFSPYSFQGGTVAAIAGENFVVIGGDTRLSTDGRVVQTRHCEKVFKLDNNLVLASTGFLGDIIQLVRVMEARMKVYRYTYNEPLGINAAAQMLSRILYYKRFFPYYAQNILAGIDDDGKGALYGYDPVGTIERTITDVTGAGREVLQSFLDNQVEGTTQKKGTLPPLTVERAKSLLRDGFRAVAERETSTGDGLYFITLMAGKAPEEEIVPVRAD